MASSVCAYVGCAELNYLTTWELLLHIFIIRHGEKGVNETGKVLALRKDIHQDEGRCIHVGNPGKGWCQLRSAE